MNKVGFDSMQQCMPDEHNDFADWDLRNYVFFKTEQTKTVYRDSNAIHNVIKTAIGLIYVRPSFFFNSLVYCPQNRKPMMYIKLSFEYYELNLKIYKNIL